MKALCEHGAAVCQPSREGHGEPHVEHTFEFRPGDGYVCCLRCGHIKPRAGWRGTCVGQVKVELR